MSCETPNPSLARHPLCLAVIMAFLASWGIGVHIMTLSACPSSLVLRNHINPNEAGLPALMALPGIGPARAQAIVNYRNQTGAPGTAIFTEPHDLMAVPGLGPVSVQRLTPYLSFASSSLPDRHEKVLDAATDSIIMP